MKVKSKTRKAPLRQKRWMFAQVDCRVSAGLYSRPSFVFVQAKKSTHSKKAMRSIMTKQSNREKQRHQTRKLKRRWMLRISRPITGLDLRTANRRKGNPKQIQEFNTKCRFFVSSSFTSAQVSSTFPFLEEMVRFHFEIWSAETFEAEQVISWDDI